MEKQVVQKRWKLIFWGLTAAAVALLAPGLVLTLVVNTTAEGYEQAMEHQTVLGWLRDKFRR